MRSMLTSAWFWLAAVTVLAGALAVGWWAYDASAPDVPEGLFAASGRVEVPRVRLSSPVGGRALEVRVDEGDRVSKGDTLVRFDTRQLEASLQAARAETEAARAEARALGLRVAALEQDLALARSEADRYRRLAGSEAAPQQAADQAETTRLRLQYEIDAVRASRDAANSGIQAAESRAAFLEARLDDAVVTAPTAGRIETKLVREGEVAGSGQLLLELLRESEADVTVYLPLDRAQLVHPGTEARIWVGSDTRTLPGTVTRVSREAEFTPKDVHMPDERTSLVYAVEVRIDAPGEPPGDGFPADVLLRVDPATPWLDRPPW